MSDIQAPGKSKNGPHGGTWVKTESSFVEISVFETGVPPRFRLYFYDMAGKAVALPPAGDIALETSRPDGKQQQFSFRQELDYLEAASELPEPHEFAVKLEVGHHGHAQVYTAQFTEEDHQHGEGHAHGDHGHEHGGHGHADNDHGHDHGTGILGWFKSKFAHSHSIAEKTDTAMESNELGIKTLKTTLIILGITALFQVTIVFFSGSVALLADTIHNFADASTSVPLWIAFALARRGANRRFTYGYGKIEDVAGVLIVLIIFFSACVAAYESVMKIIHPVPMENLGWVIAASIAGFIGNEWVAMYRIRVGKEIGSAALVADGYHARVDGFTSLAVLLGVIGVWLGFPIVDPLVGVGITLAILYIVKDAAKSVWIRLIDGIEPEILTQIEHAPMHVAGVKAVHDVRARWLGHRVYADVVIEVAPELNVRDADNLAKAVEQSLHGHVRLLGSAVVRIRPIEP